MLKLNDSPQNKKKKSRGKGKKSSAEESKQDDGEEDKREAEPVLQKGGQRGGESSSKRSGLSLYPSWKRPSSDSEFSDPEGNAQSKLRYRDHALHVHPCYWHLMHVEG